MNNELLDNTEVYVEKSQAHRMKIADMDEKYEYHPCENNRNTFVTIGPYSYCLVKKKEKIEVCVTEDVVPKFWNHDFISAKLWFDSYVEAVENNKQCVKVYRDIDPHQLMSLLFYFELPAKKYTYISELIEATESVLSEISDNCRTIAKRHLIKYFNQ